MNPVTQVVNMVQFNKKVVGAAVVARVIELESKSTFKTYTSPDLNGDKNLRLVFKKIKFVPKETSYELINIITPGLNETVLPRDSRHTSCYN